MKIPTTIKKCSIPTSSFARCDEKNKGKVFTEAPAHLFINKKVCTTFMCTPFQFEELTLGHLLTEGYIHNKKDVMKYTVEKEKDSFHIHVYISHKKEEIQGSIEPLHTKNTPFFSLQQLEQAATVMVNNAKLYNLTGGVHSAALGDGKQLFCCEDIGRSNALDKAVGCGVLQKMDLACCFVLVTGRIAFEMLQKTMVAQIPVLVSLNIPSDLSVKIAREKGITLIGKMLKKECYVYAHSERIK